MDLISFLCDLNCHNLIFSNLEFEDFLNVTSTCKSLNVFQKERVNDVLIERLDLTLINTIKRCSIKIDFKFPKAKELKLDDYIFHTNEVLQTIFLNMTQTIDLQIYFYNTLIPMKAFHNLKHLTSLCLTLGMIGDAAKIIYYIFTDSECSLFKTLQCLFLYTTSRRDDWSNLKNSQTKLLNQYHKELIKKSKKKKILQFTNLKTLLLDSEFFYFLLPMFSYINPFQNLDYIKINSTLREPPLTELQFENIKFESLIFHKLKTVNIYFSDKQRVWNNLDDNLYNIINEFLVCLLKNNITLKNLHLIGEEVLDFLRFLPLTLPNLKYLYLSDFVVNNIKNSEFFNAIPTLENLEEFQCLPRDNYRSDQLDSDVLLKTLPPKLKKLVFSITNNKFKIFQQEHLHRFQNLLHLRIDISLEVKSNVDSILYNLCQLSKLKYLRINVYDHFNDITDWSELFYIWNICLLQDQNIFPSLEIFELHNIKNIKNSLLLIFQLQMTKFRNEWGIEIPFRIELV